MRMAHVKRNPDGTWAEPHLLERHIEETRPEWARAFRIFLNRLNYDG